MFLRHIVVQREKRGIGMIMDLLKDYYACTILCMLFIIFILTDKSFNRKTEQLFLTTAVVILSLSMVDGMNRLQAELGGQILARRIYSAVDCALSPAPAILVTFIMNRRTTSFRNTRLPLFLSLFVTNIIISFLSIFNGCVFDYSISNEYSHGYLWILPFITSGTYIMLMLMSAFMNIRFRRLGENAIVITIAVFSMLGMFTEALFGISAILNVSCAIGVVFYYMYLHISMYATDQLTQAFNRRIFFLDMDKLKHREAVVVAIDLNNLKELNDQHGHAAGDLALMALADAIHENAPSNCVFYRMGGDEFELLCYKMTLIEVGRLMQKIETVMNETSYSFAYGMAEVTPDEDVDSICNRADIEMYQMKMRMKSIAKTEINSSVRLRKICQTQSSSAIS